MLKFIILFITFSSLVFAGVKEGGGGGICKDDLNLTYERLLEKMISTTVLYESVSAKEVMESYLQISKVIPRDSLIRECFSEQNVAACTNVQEKTISFFCKKDSNHHENWFSLGEIEKERRLLHELLYFVEDVNDYKSNISAEIVKRINLPKTENCRIAFVSDLWSLKENKNYYLHRTEPSPKKKEIVTGKGWALYDSLKYIYLKSQNEAQSFWTYDIQEMIMENQSPHILQFHSCEVHVSDSGLISQLIKNCKPSYSLMRWDLEFNTGVTVKAFDKIEEMPTCEKHNNR